MVVVMETRGKRGAVVSFFHLFLPTHNTHIHTTHTCAHTYTDRIHI